MEPEGRDGGEPLRTSRLIGFSDGVFAVVITLLVLNIQVPGEPISLHSLIARQAPNCIMFVITFAMIGVKWLNHHRLFELIRRVDTTLNILNLLLLLGICAVPFTTALIAKYLNTPDAAFASTIYGIVWTINGFLYTAILVYALRRGLTETRGPAETYRPLHRLVLLYVIGPLSYLVAIGVSFFNVYAGIALYVVIVSLYIPPQRVSKQ